MNTFIIIILAIFVAVIAYFKIGDLFSPWMITAGIWLAIIVMLQFQADVLYPLSNQFYTCLLLWVPIMITTSMITYYVLPRLKIAEVNLREIPLNQSIFTFLYVASIIATPLYVYQILKIVTMFDTTDFFYNLRILAVYGDQNYGILNYTYVINQVLLVVALWRFPKIPLWQIITIFIAAFLSCVAIMEKGGFFFMVLSTLFVLYEKGTIKIRSILITISVVILLFFLMNSLRTTDNSSDQDMTFLDFFAIYVLSPSVAFGKVHTDLSTQFGSHTFQVIYLFLNRFGGNFEVNTKLQEFVWVPLPTNVYTIFQPFFQDFGYAGVAFFSFLYGLFTGWAYYLFRKGNCIARCIYTYFVYVLIQQFYQENIMLSMVIFIQYIFFTIIILQKKIFLNLSK